MKEKFFVEKISDVAVPKDKEFFGYPTMVRLSHNGEKDGTLLATFARYGAWKGYDVYESTDNGDSWHYLSTALDTIHEKILNAILQPCLFEIPCDMGKYKAGTLILGACTNFEDNGVKKTALVFYLSTDGGKSWNAHMDLCYGGTAAEKLGVWEPFFIFDDKTERLYCYYSDERDDEGNRKAGPDAQKLVYQYTTDLENWSELGYALDGDEPKYRPGMISIAKMGNGEYFMIYEIVGLPRSPIYYKKTTDIGKWDDIKDYGTLIQTSDGKSFGSAPWCGWTPCGGECGTLFVAGCFMTGGSAMNGKNDLFISNDYGKTFTAIPDFLTISVCDNHKSGYSPYIGFSHDGETMYYLNNPMCKDGQQKICFARIKIK